MNRIEGCVWVVTFAGKDRKKKRKK